MKKQYIVQSDSINDRTSLYNYLIDNEFVPISNFMNRDFINNKFPFVIESDKTFWICQSITCCAAAVSSNAIITVDEYFNIVNKNVKKLSLKMKK